MSLSCEAPMVGDSEPMRRLRDLIGRIGPTDLPVLVVGETGSGKELAARALHRASRRRGPFVAVNVCAIADSMFEDAMFGHAIGAFTGAHAARDGYFKEADGGTLFLDEISGLGRDAQSKLLRVVETGQFRPVGARCDQMTEVRIVAASNEEIEALVAGGRFRADLAHRLCGFQLCVPSLRERRGDVPLLVEHALRRHRSPTRERLQVTECGLDLLRAGAWLGNVRELLHLIDRAVALSGTDCLLDADALRRAGARCGDTVATLERAGAVASPWARPRETLLHSLRRHGGDTRAVAGEFGVTRKTVYEWLRRHGLPTRRVHLFHLLHSEQGESSEAGIPLHRGA